MTDPDVNYEINSPYVIHETVDAETFVVDYTTGYYFSLDEAGTWVWKILAAGPVCLNALFQEMELQGPVDKKGKEKVESFFNELIHARLIVESSTGGRKPETGTVAGGVSPQGKNKIEWAKIKMNKFTDMKMLIRLDPVHEIDGRGWPQRDEQSS